MIGYRPFASLAGDYLERGFSPLPILSGTKVPGHRGSFLKDWSRYCRNPMSAEEIDRIAFEDPRAGLGLAMGFNDVAGLDVDSTKAYDAVREVFGNLHAPAKTGRKGATAFFCAPGIASRKFLEKPIVGPDGKIIRPPLVEVLACGNQTLIPPTLYPVEGVGFYRWVKGCLLDVKRVSELPLLTQAHLDQLEELLAPLMEPKSEAEPIVLRPASRRIEVGERKRYEGFARKALAAEADRIAATPKGGRNRQCFESTCLVGKWLHHGIVPSSALYAFVDACDRNGLVKENGRHDVMRTIRAGLAASASDRLPVLQDRPRHSRYGTAGKSLSRGASR
jgi:hypothetical protein